MNRAEQYDIKSHSSAWLTVATMALMKSFFMDYYSWRIKGGLSVDVCMFYRHIVASQMFHLFIG